MLIELSGTPSSGKNSLIKSLKEKGDFKIDVLEESGVLNDFDFDIRTHELRTLWRILDTYLKTVQIIRTKINNSSDIFILNRGLFDRIAWARLLGHKNQDYKIVSKDIENNLERYINKIDIIFLLISPYEKVKQRRKENDLGANEVFVNQETIAVLNKIYLDIFRKFDSEAVIIKIDETDQDVSLEDKINLVKKHLSQHCDRPSP